jgi:hypothetical protein
MPELNEQQTPQNQSGTGGEEFRFPERLGELEVPEKFRGKTAAEALKTYVEGEKAFGQRADYDDLKRRTSEYERTLSTWNQWAPYLEKIGWDARKLDQLATGQAGPAQSGVSMEAWAQRWANVSPEEQLPYLLRDVIAPLYQAAQAEYTKGLTTQLQQAFQQQTAYQAQKEKLLFSMLKAVLPDKDIDGIYNAALQRAEQMTQQGFDPFQAVMESELSKRQREEDEKKLRQQIRAEVEQELQSRSGQALPRSTAIRSKAQPSDRPKGREAIRAAAVRAALETAPHLAR